MFATGLTPAKKETMKNRTALLVIAFASAFTSTNIASADAVEIMLSNKLNGNLDSYCLDISGSKQNANISKGLQTHTCYAYQGQMGIDQMFDTQKLAEQYLYMPEFGVCATLSALEPGTSIGLTSCKDASIQKIVLTEAGRLSPESNMDLCLTAGEATKLGRGGTSEHQIKSLTLENCSDDLSDYQLWETRG